MKLKTLYSRTSTGATNHWTIEVEGDKYRTIYGQVGSNTITTTEWSVAKATNEGRANHRTPEEQAMFIAESMHQKRLENKYFLDINDIDKKNFTKPMLAKVYNDRKDKISFPLYSQPKLDGIRCIADSDGLMSRNGKPISGVPHIFEKLQPFFDKHPGIIFDGELYCNKLNNDFNKIISLVRKAKPNKSEMAEAAEVIQYWIYDIVDPTMKFKERIEFISELAKEFPKELVMCPTHGINTEDELDLHFSAYIEDGYEGQMVRTNSKYENKRSASLLKRKEFTDDEYEILDICEGRGNRSGMAGYAVMKNTNPTAIGVGKNTFQSAFKGNHEYLKDLLINKERYIGEMATIKFFNLTPDGVPRFPVLTAIRNYE